MLRVFWLLWILGLCSMFVPYLWCFMCCMFWGCFVPNFSGVFYLNVVRICWGCCDLTIWIWGKCCVKVVYDFLVFYSFFFSSVLFFCSSCFGLGLCRCFFFFVVGFFCVLTFCSLKCQSYRWGIQPFLSVSQVFVLCIVHSVPALFVAILLYGFLYNAVYTHNSFYIMPFH